MTAAPVSSLAVDGPPRGLRLPIYAFAWLPVLVGSMVFVPRFEPIWSRFEEHGERLPLASNVLVTFSRYDQVSYHFLSLLVIVGILSLDEAMMQLLRLFRRGSGWVWVWFAFVLFSGIYLFGMVLYALVLPVTRL
jgi:hypothetical protein